MKYSYNWLQSHIEEKLPSPEALREKIIFGAFEVESVEHIAGDTVFDIKVLPDRAGDCLSHYGMAREIAGLFDLTLKPLQEMTLPSEALAIPLEVQSCECRRYIAVRMEGVLVGASPQWLKQKLQAIGQKSINNVVDATNYVLYDLGQPTHAYDATRIDGGISVRAAKPDEKIITLSDEEKTLSSDMLVIADYIGPLAIAGIKGGKNAEISLGAKDTTVSSTSIILEIANFDPVSIRRTAGALGLHTDAAKRFENNLSPSVCALAAAKLVALITEVAGGNPTQMSDYYPAPQEERTITFSAEDIARSLGPIASKDVIEKVFTQYGYARAWEGETCTLTIPLYRSDISGAHDIAEEVGRVLGYERIEACALPETFASEHSPVYLEMRAARAWLVHAGYREVQTYTFRKKGVVEIARGPKNKNFLRTTLSEGLKESFDLNTKNVPLVGSVKLFEIGSVFPSDGEEIHVATVDEAGVVHEWKLSNYIEEQHIVVEGTTLECTPSSTLFTPWSVYPFVVRDIALWLSAPSDQAALEDILTRFAREHCPVAPVLFDTFTKDGATSVAYRLVFQAMDHTLTDTEVETWIAPLLDELKADQRFTVR